MNKGINNCINKDIIHDIKKYILKGFESKIEQILMDKSKNMFLSERDLLSLSLFMERHEILSYCVIKFIFKRSIYSHNLHDKIINSFNRIILIACEKGHFKVVRLLLSDEVVQIYKSLYLSIIYNNGFGAACKGGNLDLVKFLLRYSGYDPKMIDPGGNFSPLLSACDFNHIELVKFFLSEEMIKLCPRLDPCSSDNLLFRNACIRGNLELVKFLLSNETMKLFPNIDPAVNSNGPIIFACQSTRFNIVNFLLSDEIIERFPKIDPTEQNNFILRSACIFGAFDTVKLVLSDKMRSRFPSINHKVNNDYCKKIASCREYHDIVKILLELDDSLRS